MRRAIASLIPPPHPHPPTPLLTILPLMGASVTAVVVQAEGHVEMSKVDMLLVPPPPPHRPPPLPPTHRNPSWMQI